MKDASQQKVIRCFIGCRPWCPIRVPDGIANIVYLPARAFRPLQPGKFAGIQWPGIPI